MITIQQDKHFVVSAADGTEHWATKYIGEAYEWGVNDCWMFCRRVWEIEFGFVVPILSINNSSLRTITRVMANDGERLNWTKESSPREGDAVLLAHSRFPSHIGIWVDADGGGVLHCQDEDGVIFNSRQALLRAGWIELQFFRRKQL
jgi:cell wall-associated NlpC family hydrolase